MESRGDPAAATQTPFTVRVAPEVLSGGPMQALLQRGVRVPALLPCPLSGLLIEQLGVAPEVVERRISTIFVDGSVVDSVEATVLGPGSVLALSAAMPGLVGATLRRGGYYARMRAAITAEAGAAAAPAAAAPAALTVKLFNLLVAELGPHLLAHGILLSREQAAGIVDPAALPAGAAELLLTTAPEAP